MKTTLNFGVIMKEWVVYVLQVKECLALQVCSYMY